MLATIPAAHDLRRVARPTGLGAIYARLAEASARPRYAFLVLGLIAEACGADGRAGPFVDRGEGPVALRDWIAAELLPLSAARRGRGAVEDQRDEEAALAIGKANVSRAVSDLVRAGLVKRHYAGRVTNHVNRGGGRLAAPAEPSGFGLQGLPGWSRGTGARLAIPRRLHAQLARYSGGVAGDGSI